MQTSQETSPRPNLYHELKPAIQLWGNVIDIGCQHLYDLIDFETSDYKKLIGFDKWSINVSSDYRQSRKWGRTDPSKNDLNSFYLSRYLNQRFETIQGDLTTYNFGTEDYSLVLCNKVLHFFPHVKQLELIDIFYKSLQPLGLMRLVINHYDNGEYHDEKKSQPYGVNGFRGISRKTGKLNDLIHYPVKPEVILSQLSMYEVLAEFTVTKSPVFICVIRKKSVPKTE